jgi:hypothetical protein
MTGKLINLLLNNFTNVQQATGISGMVTLIETFKRDMGAFMETDAKLFVWEAIRRGLFPNAMSDYVGEVDAEIHAQVVDMGQTIQTFWTSMLEIVMTNNKNLYKDTVKINAIRPILKVDWQTTIIPQSSMVFFRYINQMGYRTKFKFTPTAQNMARVVSNESEQKILQMIQSYVEVNGTIDTIRSSDVVAHIQAAFPEININRGTPVWNLISGYVQQLKPANV